jgi:hypothetical protein
MPHHARERPAQIRTAMARSRQAHGLFSRQRPNAAHRMRLAAVSSVTRRKGGRTLAGSGRDRRSWSPTACNIPCNRGRLIMVLPRLIFRVVQPFGRDQARESTMISEHATAAEAVRRDRSPVRADGALVRRVMRSSSSCRCGWADRVSSRRALTGRQRARRAGCCGTLCRSVAPTTAGACVRSPRVSVHWGLCNINRTVIRHRSIGASPA